MWDYMLQYDEEVTNMSEIDLSESVDLIDRHTNRDGTFQSAIPSLYVARRSQPVGPLYGIRKPAICIVVQGNKTISFGKEILNYGPGDYLISSVDLPIIGKINNASKEKPFLCLNLEFTSQQILEVISAGGGQSTSESKHKQGIFVDKLEYPLNDAATRLLKLLDTPDDIPTLAPLITKELIYRILQGAHGYVLEQTLLKSSVSYKVNDAVSYIRDRYMDSLTIEEVAKVANMGVSTLHRYFKEVTGSSPLQYQKQIRLQEARNLLMLKSGNVTEVALTVGYESASQFSREYSRMFGLSPKEDMKYLKQAVDIA